MNPFERLLTTLRGWFAADADKLKAVNDAASEIEAAQKQAAASQQQQQQSTGAPDLSGLSPQIVTLIQGQTAQITKLTEQLTEISTRDQAREKAIQAAAAADQTKKIAADIEKAVADRKLAPKDEDSKKLWQTLLESNYEQAKAALDKLPATVAPEKGTQTNQNQLQTTQTTAPLDRATLVANARAAFAENESK